jgi:hypothetical protein
VSTIPDACKCGLPVTRVEVVVVQRCSKGHFVSSGAAPAILRTTPVSEPQSPGQQRAFHAKTNLIDKTLGRPVGSTKRELLAELGVESSTALDSNGMSRALDQLEEQLALLATEGVAPSV